ncbi:MAG: polyprenyl synthetase family protein [Candidatus Margulisbacteria bacterium]|nr:polyprenyl synthetase family protein [Candidatus Margulisiibacteriota bacterium]
MTTTSPPPLPLDTFESALDAALTFDITDRRKPLEDAIRYSALAAGKRIRPQLCMAIEKSLTNSINVSIPIGIAIELIHCYSLIHDDLPAMDNDDFRRGKPTCHKAFGEDMAILAGDVLNTYAFEYLATTMPPVIGDKKTVALIQLLSNACGIHGMGGGQALDLKSSLTQDATLDDVQTIHHLKTGQLFLACFTMTSTAACDDADVCQTIMAIGRHFGLMFQMIDDILDATAAFESIGKSPGKDANQNKLTIVSLLGLEAAIKEAQAQKERALHLIHGLPNPAPNLSHIFETVFNKGIQYAK